MKEITEPVIQPLLVPIFQYIFPSPEISGVLGELYSSRELYNSLELTDSEV